MPIVHVNGFRMGARSVLGGMDDDELRKFAAGTGWRAEVVRVGGAEDHASFGNVLDDALHATAKGATVAVFLRCVKGWGGPDSLDGQRLIGTPALHKTPLGEALARMSLEATLVTLSNVICVEADTADIHGRFSTWIGGYFQSCRLGYAKPDARAFEAVASAFGLTTAATPHIGDDWYCDVVGATTAGARAVWISRGRPVPDCGALDHLDVVVAEDFPAAADHVRNFARGRP
jgi:hypothetical protein